jgi:hypothetical protein
VHVQCGRPQVLQPRSFEKADVQIGVASDAKSEVTLLRSYIQVQRQPAQIYQEEYQEGAFPF